MTNPDQAALCGAGQASDTSNDAAQRQLALWRLMSPASKAAAVDDISSTVRNLALAGIRHRYPEAIQRECFLRLAVLTLGHELARRAYPEIASLPR